MHRTFAELGRELGSTWGFDDDGNLDKQIKDMKGDRRVYCMLAAIFQEMVTTRDESRELRRVLLDGIRTTNANLKLVEEKASNERANERANVRAELEVLRQLVDLHTSQGPRRVEPAEPPRDFMADAMWQWMRTAGGDRLISELDYSHLSVRARNSINRLRAEMLSEVTPAKLAKVRHCGRATIEEIMNWVNKVYSGARSVTNKEKQG